MVVTLRSNKLQISMTYTYWKAGRQNDYAVFDMFFRKNPFNGEFTIFAGLSEVCHVGRVFMSSWSLICLIVLLRTILRSLQAIKLVQTFKFEAEHIDFLRRVMPECDPAFWGALMVCQVETSRYQ
jgi:nicotinic acid phosphoribosyltransferase